LDAEKIHGHNQKDYQRRRLPLNHQNNQTNDCQRQDHRGQEKFLYGVNQKTRIASPEESRGAQLEEFCRANLSNRVWIN
jgi:hypothetical protein